ncbi:hypothetical protein FF38_08420 [Lucilia cuprina]|uniref:Uncharacterized protein n=1 Tax=Lucilia cuprina TaxID=7375 RepID=A0A0L0CGZ9_LUCCU|nr:hypothetical protein FF38_08420 [Lucilia cuprina]
MLLMLFELHGLKIGGGGTGAAGRPKLRVFRPLILRQWPPPDVLGGKMSSKDRPEIAIPLNEMWEPSIFPLWPWPAPPDIIDCGSGGGTAFPCGHIDPVVGVIAEQPPTPPMQPAPTPAASVDDHCTQPPPPPLRIPDTEVAAAPRRLFD